MTFESTYDIPEYIISGITIFVNSTVFVYITVFITVIRYIYDFDFQIQRTFSFRIIVTLSNDMVKIKYFNHINTCRQTNWFVICDIQSTDSEILSAITFNSSYFMNSYTDDFRFKTCVNFINNCFNNWFFYSYGSCIGFNLCHVSNDLKV